MIFKFMPGLKQLFQYKHTNLKGDISAGVIVAFLLIPQAMAYAIIAGVPLAVGLLAGTFPLIIYVLFGGSKYLSVGPVSIVSLLAFSGIASMVQPNSSQFLEVMILLTLIVGIVQLLMGFIKFGSILDYISPAMISGFTTAAAIIIALNQVKSILGISLESYQNLFSYLHEIIDHLHDANPYTVGIGVASLLLLFVIKKKFLTGPFLLIIASVLVVNYLDLSQKGVAIVGEIPQKAIGFSLHLPNLDTLISLFPIAFMIAFISFAESYAVAKTLANKENEQLNPNQELFGLGLANVTSSLVGSIPVAGAISRTAVNHQSGAKSNLSMLVTAVFMLLAILYLTPLFYYLPKAALAAIIIVAVSNLIDVKQFLYYLKNKPTDAVIFLATFVTVLMIDVFVGLVIGILLSLVVNLIRKRIVVAT